MVLSSICFAPGRSRQVFLTHRNRPPVILPWIPPSEIFGSAALWAPPARYHASAETVSNSSATGPRFEVWLCDLQGCLRMHFLSLYVAAYCTAHIALLCGTGRERLAHVLINLANGTGNKVAGGIETKDQERRIGLCLEVGLMDGGAPPAEIFRVRRNNHLPQGFSGEQPKKSLGVMKIRYNRFARFNIVSQVDPT